MPRSYMSSNLCNNLFEIAGIARIADMRTILSFSPPKPADSIKLNKFLKIGLHLLNYGITGKEIRHINYDVSFFLQKGLYYLLDSFNHYF